MDIFKTTYFLILLFCVLGLKAEIIPYTLSDTQTENSLSNFNNSFFETEHTLEELKELINQCDTYDFVRTKNQREELVRYLLEEFKKHNYEPGIAKCENILGVLFRDRAEYAKAIEIHESALKHSQSDTMLLIFSLNNLGVVYRRLDKPRLALDYHMEALNLAEEVSGESVVNKRSTCVALNSIGNINLILNQPHRALDVFFQTLKMEQELGNPLGMAINYQNIGFCYEAIDDYETALNYYEKSLSKNTEINSDVGKSICHNSIGEVLLKQGKSYEALETFNKALIFAEITGDDYYISQSQANIGKSYLILGVYDKAYNQFVEFNKLATKINSSFLIQNSYELLSEYYEEIGDFENALENYKQAKSINDSIVSEKNSRYLNEIQTIYDTDKKQQKIELLTIENQVRKQRYLFYIFGIFVFALIVLVFYVISRRRSDKRNQELEARLFRSLMNPHFLFNALGSIQNFLYQNESAKAANFLGKFSKLTRSILQNSNKELITLEEEINSLRHYIEIEQMRHNNSFSYSIDCDDNIELDFVYVLPTMIQPFVENGILHGFKSLPDHTGQLIIGIEQLKDHVRIQIKDNGKGIKSAITDKKNPKHKSMGMNIFKERIKNIERKYKKSVNFGVQDRKEIDPNESGTIVTIDFPLIEPHD